MGVHCGDLFILALKSFGLLENRTAIFNPSKSLVAASPIGRWVGFLWVGISRGWDPEVCMIEPPRSPARFMFASLAAITIVVCSTAAVFAYTAGWLSSHRLTATKIVDALAPATGPALGHRRNHVKGICFTGVFEANGAGTALSRAEVFSQGRYPALGRFNVATANIGAPDATVRVRGIGLSISTPDGQEWRSAMIDAPVFPASTPQAFYQLLLASASKDPNAMATYAQAHPEIAGFGAWAKTAPWTGSYAEERFNSLNSFVFANASGAESTVRWSILPAATPVAVAPEDLAKRAPDFLEQEIATRVRNQPQSWTLVVTVADPGDPVADPTKAWPAERRAVEVGTLVVQQIEAEPDGPCRDINFDPTVLPSGISTSDDPFPAARSAAYAKSYDLRTAEAKDYPRAAPEAKP
jgi:catalase